MNTNIITTDAVSSEITGLAADLTGFHPALDRAVQALADLAAADLTADQSQAVVAALGGLADGSLATLLGLVLRHTANPDTNPALAGLPTDRQQTLRRLGAEYAAAIADPYMERLASEASAVIDHTADSGRAMTCLTDDERKELSRKVAKANKDSARRPK